MARRSHGPASHSVQISRGPDPRPLHFYSTNYSIHHGNRPPSAETPVGVVKMRTRGTGYSANFRPTVYYSSSQDVRDNPYMLQLLADNYTSLTAHHFRSSSAGQATSRKPHSSQNISSHSPQLGEYPAIMKPRPLSSDPKFFSSETKSTFTAKPFRDPELERSSQSVRGETGFTHAQNTEPITFRPPQPFSDLSPLPTHPASGSVMKRDFVRHSHTTGKEGIPRLTQGADESNGYVKGSNHHSQVQPKAHEMVGYTLCHQLPPSLMATTSRSDPAHFSTITQPSQFSSYTHHVLEAGRREGVRGGRGRRGGRKELTGYSENNLPLPQPLTREDGRFSTHYSAQFSRPRLHTSPGGVASQDPAHNGFSKGTQVHEFGDVRCSVPLYSMHPSQARLTLLKDPCYQDHTHSRKQHSNV